VVVLEALTELVPGAEQAYSTQRVVFSADGLADACIKAWRLQVEASGGTGFVLQFYLMVVVRTMHTSSGTLLYLV
jgi:hypothetical protein